MPRRGLLHRFSPRRSWPHVGTLARRGGSRRPSVPGLTEPGAACSLPRPHPCQAVPRRRAAGISLVSLDIGGGAPTRVPDSAQGDGAPAAGKTVPAEGEAGGALGRSGCSFRGDLGPGSFPSLLGPGFLAAEMSRLNREPVLGIPVLGVSPRPCGRGAETLEASWWAGHGNPAPGHVASPAQLRGSRPLGSPAQLRGQALLLSLAGVFTAGKHPARLGERQLGGRAERAEPAVLRVSAHTPRGRTGAPGARAWWLTERLCTLSSLAHMTPPLYR